MTLQIGTIGSNILRDNHWVLNPVTGLYERSTLVEGQGSNLCTQSESFASASWAKIGAPVTTSGAISESVMGVALDLLEDASGAAQAFYSQSIAFTGDGTKSISIYLKQGPSPAAGGSYFMLQDDTGAATRARGTITWNVSGVPTVFMAFGTLQDAPREIANGIYRIRIQAPGVIAANAHTLRVYPAAVSAETGNLYAGGAQAENSPFCTSYNKTTTLAATRQADTAYRNLPAGLSTPQAQTWYAKFIELGTIRTQNARVLHIGTSSSANALLIYAPNQNGYAILHNNGVGPVTSQALITPAHGDQVEVFATMFDDGSVSCRVSVNGGAEVVGATSAPNARGGAWNNTVVGIGCQPGSPSVTGFAAFLSRVKGARGAKSSAQMRAF